jgi:glycosyltransferase involved in cell wall biosynthesis
MRIGINAHLLSSVPTYRSAGVSHSIYHLISGLAAFDQQNEYVIFGNEAHLAPLLSHADNFEICPSPWPTNKPLSRVAFEQTMLSYLIKKYRLDFFHAPVNVLPLVSSCPGVVTIHDLAFIRYPEYFIHAKRLYQQFFTARSAHKARLVIAVSEATKRDLIDYFHIDPDNILVCYNTVDPDFRPITDEASLAAFRLCRHLPDRFLFYIGTLEPRKNLIMLVEAFECLHRVYQLPQRLVIAGAKGWLFDELFARVKDLGLEKDIIFPGFLPQEELLWWYNAADLFVYPSLYEGFGLPVVEALACGVPVVTSNISSLPEIGGDAVMVANPHDPRDFARKIYTVLTDTALATQLRHRGVSHAQKFSILSTTKQIMHAYEVASRR